MNIHINGKMSAYSTDYQSLEELANEFVQRADKNESWADKNLPMKLQVKNVFNTVIEELHIDEFRDIEYVIKRARQNWIDQINPEYLAQGCKNTDELIDKYYKKSRLRCPTVPSLERDIRNGHKERVNKYGYTVISRHESVTGNPVWFIRKYHAST